LQPTLPDKQYFKIGEVARLLGVRPSVLRYWETEFRSIKPEKSRTNQRLYHRRHVERLFQIKTLLYDQKYTIAGARRRLKDTSAPVDGAEPLEARARDILKRVRREVEELLRLAGE
jgi:DNA-binding transcriptional MerR regulator